MISIMKNSVLFRALAVSMMVAMLAPSADAQWCRMADGVRRIGKIAAKGGREIIKDSPLIVTATASKQRRELNELNRKLQQRLQWQVQQRKRLQQQEQHRRRLQQMLSTPPVALSSHRDWLVGHSASFTPSPLTSQRDALRRVSEEILVSDMPLTCTADSCATEQSITIATDSAECSSSSDALQTDRVYDR